MRGGWARSRGALDSGRAHRHVGGTWVRQCVGKGERETPGSCASILIELTRGHGARGAAAVHRVGPPLRTSGVSSAGSGVSCWEMCV